MKMKNFVLGILLYFFSTAALAQSSPLDMLQSTSDELLSALSANKTTIHNNPSAVYSIVDRIVVPHADVQSMARAALGRNAWQTATPSQREEFTQEFVILMNHTYSSALARYNDETVKFLPLRGDYHGRSSFQVNSEVQRQDGPPISVNYRLVLVGGEWKLADFTVDGVSMIGSFRSQFASELSRNDLDALIKTLKEHNRSTD